jgi:hypothetical protein
MGRPLKWGEPTEVLTVRVPASVKHRLEAQAKEIRRPVAEVVVRELGYDVPYAPEELKRIADAPSLCMHPNPVRGERYGLYCGACGSYID